MDNEKIIQPFQSETYKHIQSKFNDFVDMITTYVVLAQPFHNKINEFKQLLESAENDYNNELKEWLDNPQNTCDHENVQHKYLTDNTYEVICKDCGKVLGMFKI